MLGTVKRYHIMRNSSVFYRLSKTYFAERLKPYGLGAGQHYFLGEIGKRPGASLAELAEQGAFDNGTVTRAVSRLEREGYVRVEKNDRDRRAKRLYLTESGERLADVLAQMRLDWFLAVTEGLSETERAQVGALTGRLVENARAALAREQKKP